MAENEWLNIDTIVAEASDALGDGEFIACQTFSLYDAMSAVELMDPKMDPPSIIEKSIDLNALMLSGSLPLNNSLSRTKEICLRLMMLQISWIDGTSLAETLFTCFYLHDPLLSLLVSTLENIAPITPTEAESEINKKIHLDNIGEECLAVFVVQLLKNVSLIREVVQHADIYEEEDFSSSIFNYSFCDKVTDEVLSQNYETLFYKLEDLISEQSEENELFSNLVFFSKVIQFQALFHKTVSTIGVDISAGKHEDVDTKLKETVAITHKAIDVLRQLKLLTFSPSSEGHLDFCFDDTITKSDLGSSPPRVKFQCTISQAMDAFEHILNGVLAVSEALSLQDIKALRVALVALPLRYHHQHQVVANDNQSVATSTDKKNAAAEDSQTPSFTCSLLYRSCAVINLYVFDKFVGLLDFGVAVRELLVADGVPSAFLGDAMGSTMVERLIKPVFDTIHVQCVPYTRQRIRIEALLKDWSELFSDGQILDRAFKQKMELPDDGQYYVSDWVMIELVTMMARHIELGFALRLFENDDAPAAYWYWAYLLSVEVHLRSKLRNLKHAIRQQQVEMAKQEMENILVAKRAEAMDPGSGGGAGKNQKRGKNKKSQDKKLLQEQALMLERVVTLQRNADAAKVEEDEQARRQEAVTQLYMVLSRACVQFLMALKFAHLYEEGKGWEFTTVEERFKRRFKCFKPVKAMPELGYNDFIQNYQTTDAATLFKGACDNFKEAKFIADFAKSLAIETPHTMTATSEQLKNLKKVAIMNSIAAEVLFRDHSTGSGTCRLVLDYSLDVLFPVIKVE